MPAPRPTEDFRVQGQNKVAKLCCVELSYGMWPFVSKFSAAPPSLPAAERGNTDG